MPRSAQKQDSKPERWRVIENWPAYEVSDLGRVRRGKRLMTPCVVQSGKAGLICCVTLSDTPRQERVSVARLVLLAFRGPASSEKENNALHWDDDVANNVLPNLRWGSKGDNAHDRVRNGHSATGSRNGNVRLTAEQVVRIRAEYSKGVRGHGSKALAKRYGVHYSSIQNVINGKTWVAAGK